MIPLAIENAATNGKMHDAQGVLTSRDVDLACDYGGRGHGKDAVMFVDVHGGDYEAGHNKR